MIRQDLALDPNAPSRSNSIYSFVDAHDLVGEL